MGAKESKTFPISPEEAFKKINDAERRRLQDAYKRLSSSSASSTGNGLNKALMRSVLGEGVPPGLGDAIFNLCTGGGGKNSTLNYREVVTLLVLLTKGTREEKMKFVFGLLSNDNNTHIEKAELIRFLKEWEPQFDYKDVITLFHEQDKVGFETFLKWVESHPQSLGVVQWLLSINDKLSLTPRLDTPTFYQTLAGVTHLEEQEIIELEKRFWQLIQTSSSGRIEFDILSSLVSPPLPEELVKAFFRAFDENQDGHIDFKELSCGVSAACRGPEMERHKFCFKVFDADHDGILNKAELESMCKNLVEVKYQTLSNKDKTAQEEAEDMAKKILNQHDPKELNQLSMEEYLVWSVKNTYLEEFAKLIFQLCHIALGLRPSCRKDEGDIVLGWLERESKLPRTVGSLWYLINMEWWNAWKNYAFYTDSGMPSRLSSSEIVSSKRGSKKTPLDSTLASDSDKSVIGTSYQQLSEISAKALIESNNNGSSRTATPIDSPFSSRKSSTSTNSSTQGDAIPSRPGMIDNSSLIMASSYRVNSLTAEGGKLKSNSKLTHGRDYELIPERLWKALMQWYSGAPALPRQVIRNKDGEIELELYPLNIKLFKHQTVTRPATSSVPAMVGGMAVNIPTGSLSTSSYGSSMPSTTRRYHAHQAAFSKKTTVKQITEFLCQRLHIKPEDLRLWHFRDEANMDQLSDELLNLESVGIKDDDSLLVEVRSRDGTWPEEITSLCNSSDRRFSVLDNQHLTLPGVTGLNNLGNTCYMNASIQCVSNTKILSQYFQKNCHLHELNRVNPLGMKGHIAKRCGDLIRDMWSSETRIIAPIKLRWTIGRYRQNFAGNQQQDAQELLAFLLDGLHEDLNRVTEKPYATLKDSDGRPDVEVAREAWENHVLRNKSVVVDLFHGQLKSKVTCKVCSHESVRFDPFTFLSLPLPMESSVHLEIIVIRQDGSVPIKYGLTLDMESRYSSIKIHLSELCNISPSNLILVDIAQSHFRAIQYEEQKLKRLNGTCIYAYEFYPIQNEDRSPFQGTQTFSDIQRGAECSPKLNGNGRIPKQEDAKADTKTHKKSGSEVSHRWPSNCMNGISSCFKSKKDSVVEISTVSYHNNDVKIETEVSTSPKSDKAALLPNEGQQKPNNVREHSHVNSVKSSSVSHSRQGSSASSIQSHESQSSVNAIFSGDVGDCQHGVIVVLHRKMIPQEVYFMAADKYRPILFGIPLIVACAEKTTNQELYKQVWSQVARLVSPLPPRDTSQNHATDCDDSLRYEYPFTLKIIQRDGSWCSQCPWHRFCRGCALECDTKPFDFASSYLAIDWDQTALHLRYLSSQERAYNEDPSVLTSQRAASEPITLRKCLEAFTREEVLGEDEKYDCTSCKSRQKASIKLQIWRLPPILIVHLKRFHYLNGRWIKSHKIVDFPIYSLDLSDFLAAVPGATLMRYKSLRERKSNIKMNGTIQEVSEPNSLEMQPDDEKSGNSVQIVNQEKFRNTSEIMNQGTPDAVEKRDVMRRKRLESTSLANHPIMDDDLQDFHQHKLVKDANPLDIKYNLYSMVNHSGVLGGGHYISYGKSKSGKWYCQNDSTCKEIAEDQIDKSTAYMLFYERESLSDQDYLPGVKGSVPDIRELEEELESDFRKQCVIM